MYIFICLSEPINPLTHKLFHRTSLILHVAHLKCSIYCSDLFSYRTSSTTDLPAKEVLPVLQFRASPRGATPTTPTPTWNMTTRST